MTRQGEGAVAQNSGAIARGGALLWPERREDMRAKRRKPDSEAVGLTAAPQRTQAELRHALLCKLAAVMDRWRQCPARVCRRARRCASPALACTDLPARREMTPENEAQIRAHFYKIVRRRMAEIERGGAAPERPR